MNPQVIEEYLISSLGMEQLYPLSQPHTDIIIWTIVIFHTHTKHLLILCWRLVKYHSQVVGCVVTRMVY